MKKWKVVELPNKIIGEFSDRQEAERQLYLCNYCSKFNRDKKQYRLVKPGK